MLGDGQSALAKRPVEKRPMLLYAINRVIDLFGRQPKFNNTSEAKAAIRDFPRQMELLDDYSVFDLVRNHFSRLFNYPIYISKLSRFP